MPCVFGHRTIFGVDIATILKGFLLSDFESRSFPPVKVDAARVILLDAIRSCVIHLCQDAKVRRWCYTGGGVSQRFHTFSQLCLTYVDVKCCETPPPV